MLIINSKIDINTSYPLQYSDKWEDLLFFDIETTGFSANTSYLYLIGCMYYAENTWQMTQWLAADLASEALILDAFIQKIKLYKRLVHYNGSGFDIPFILQKCKKYQIPDPFQSIESFDIYKKILPIKKMLPLANLKLKTLEEFVHVDREDSYSGGDLIKVYSSFLGRLQYEKLYQKRISEITDSFVPDRNYEVPIDSLQNPSSEDLKDLLLLHNKDDIKGLLKIADVLYYVDLYHLNFQTEIQKLEIKQIYYNNFYRLEFTLPYKVPEPISWKISPDILSENSFITDDITLNVNADSLILQVPVSKGELKYFFDNYKDYYYLPKEDIAVHKSIAQYVDKEFREHAKADNCYNKLTSSFLPQPSIIFTPAFKENYHSKLCFFDKNNDSLQQTDKIYEYMSTWINFIISDKETQITINDKI